MLHTHPLVATLLAAPLLLASLSASLVAQSAAPSTPALPAPAALVSLDRAASPSDFALAADGQAAAIYVAPGNPEAVRTAADAFASDVEQVTGLKPRLLPTLAAPLPAITNARRTPGIGVATTSVTADSHLPETSVMLSLWVAAR